MTPTNTVTDAETRLERAIALKPSSGMALVPVDAVTAVLASLATLREGMRLLNEEIDTVGNERDALRAENARLRERDAQPARLGGTSN
jgi:hypothetical protein